MRALLWTLGLAATTTSALRSKTKQHAAPLTTTQTLIAGGASRAAAQLLMYPADALRTLAQTRTGAKTLAELGAKTLVNGCVFTSCFAFPVGAIQFAVLGRARRAIARRQPKTPSTLVDVQASACAALASCSVTVPQEVLKQRLVAGIYPNVFAAVKNIARTEGPRGFFVGALPTAARNVPFVVVTFTVYGALSAWRGEAKSTAESLGRGVTAALVAGVVTQPVDVVKTRMMTQAASSLPPYKNVGDCIATIARDEGPRTFYTGLPQRSAYMGPLWALQFAGHDYLTKVFRRRNARRSSSRRH
jgi:solute carrier family 25 S-adenosylmethionine transporter 26